MVGFIVEEGIGVNVGEGSIVEVGVAVGIYVGEGRGVFEGTAVGVSVIVGTKVGVLVATQPKLRMIVGPVKLRCSLDPSPPMSSSPTVTSTFCTFRVSTSVNPIHLVVWLPQPWPRLVEDPHLLRSVPIFSVISTLGAKALPFLSYVIIVAG